MAWSDVVRGRLCFLAAVVAWWYVTEVPARQVLPGGRGCLVVRRRGPHHVLTRGRGCVVVRR